MNTRLNLEGDGRLLTDTKIRLLDSKGGEIMALDDVDMDDDGVADSLIILRSSLRLKQVAAHMKYYIEVSAYTGNPRYKCIL